MTAGKRLNFVFPKFERGTGGKDLRNLLFSVFLTQSFQFPAPCPLYCRILQDGFRPIYRWDHLFSLLCRWDDHHPVGPYDELGLGPLIVPREAQIDGPFHRPSLGDIDAARWIILSSSG